MVMSVCGYAQKYEVGTTTAVWKAPAAADFLHAKATGVKYIPASIQSSPSTNPIYSPLASLAPLALASTCP